MFSGLRGFAAGLYLVCMMALRTLFGGGWRRAIRIALAVGAMAVLTVSGVRLWQDTTGHEWRLLGLGTLARARFAAGADGFALQRYERYRSAGPPGVG